MPREIIHGPNWSLGLELAYLPHTTVGWWEAFVRMTRYGKDRRRMFENLIAYLQSPELVGNYRALIPKNDEAKTMYQRLHPHCRKIPSEARLNQFYARIPRIIRMLKDEIEK